MKRSLLVIGLALVMAGFGRAQETAKGTEVAEANFDADFPAGGQLRMHIRSADLRVIGSDENKIKIRYCGKNASQARDVKISLKKAGSKAELRVHGGPRNNFQIVISIPRNSDLFLRMPAGDAEVENLLGNKDVEIHAGDLTLAVGQPELYAETDASVLAGDLETGPFGVSKDGLFRSFHQQGAGKYKLHAHVGAGDLTLKP